MREKHKVIVTTKGRRKNNPIAKKLSDPLWQIQIVKSRMVYNRKLKHKKE